MRIVHVLPFFWPATRFGGPVRQVYEISRRQARRGHEVTVITSDLGASHTNASAADPPDVVIHRAAANWYGQASPYLLPAAKAALREAVATADVVHAHLAFHHLNVQAASLCRHLGKPLIYAPRSCLDPVRLAQRRSLKRAFIFLFERRVWTAVTLFHCLTADEASDVAALGVSPERTAVTPNAVEPPLRTPQRTEARRRLGLPEDAIVVLFMSRLHRVKGVPLLVDAFAQVAEREPKAMLFLAGPDEGERKATEQRLGALGLTERVRIPGHLDGDQREDAFAAADVFALPSWSEGMPNAVLEAAARGLPCVITPGCHLPELQAHDAGLIVQPEVDPLADALAQFCRDAGRRQASGESARAMVQAHFTFGRVLDGLDDMYSRAVLLRRKGQAHDDHC